MMRKYACSMLAWADSAVCCVVVVGQKGKSKVQRAPVATLAELCAMHLQAFSVYRASSLDLLELCHQAMDTELTWSRRERQCAQYRRELRHKRHDLPPLPPCSSWTSRGDATTVVYALQRTGWVLPGPLASLRLQL